jgi:hypothetical protein
MKKFLVIILSIVIVLSLVACGSVDNSVYVNVENGDELANTAFGKSVMMEIGDGLWYDSTTRIVYWWNGHLEYMYKSSTTPSPYYAPNGLPYRYNPESNMFEEIDIDG